MLRHLCSLYNLRDNDSVEDEIANARSSIEREFKIRFVNNENLLEKRGKMVTNVLQAIESAGIKWYLIDVDIKFFSQSGN